MRAPTIRLSSFSTLADRATRPATDRPRCAPCATDHGAIPTGCPGWCEYARPADLFELEPRGSLPVPGERVGDRLVLERLLGKGGLGVVYRAFDELLRRHVAIKFLGPRWVRNAAVRARFTTEARAMARVRHENLLSLFEVGLHRGWPFLVTEFVDGVDLARRLESSTTARVPLEQVARIAGGVARGIATLHEHGILHGDVKPGNVLLGRNGRVVLGDFGLARPLSSVCRTQTGEVSGTPAYMAPEVASGLADSLHATQDVYGLAVLTYELCTGRLPFSAKGRGPLVARQLTASPPRPSTLRPELDEQLDRVLLRALHRDPGQRTPTVQAFLSAFEQGIDAQLDPSLRDRERRPTGLDGSPRVVM